MCQCEKLHIVDILLHVKHMNSIVVYHTDNVTIISFLAVI